MILSKSMPYKKKLISSLIIISLFISNVGFVFKYECCIETAEIVFNALNDEKCCVEIVEKKVDDCCSIESEKNVIFVTDQHHCSGYCFSTSEYKKLDIKQISLKTEKIFHFFVKLCTLNVYHKTNAIVEYVINNEDIFLCADNHGKNLIITIHKIKIPSPTSILV